MDVGHDQLSQEGLGLAEDVKAVGEGLFCLVLALLSFGDDQTAEGAQAISGIMQDNRERCT